MNLENEEPTGNLTLFYSDRFGHFAPEPAVSRARILLADDHTLVLAGLRSLLEAEFEVVGAVEDGPALIEAAGRFAPDVVLLDIYMPGMSGIDAARRLRASTPSLKIVFVTMHADPGCVREALRTGPCGFVLKRSAAAELTAAIRAALAGQSYVSPLVGAGKPGPADGCGASGKALTARQRQVLRLIAEGRTAQEIGGFLKISPKTAEFHRAGIMQRLGLRTTAALTRYAIRHGIADE